MELINATSLPASCIPGLDPDGGERLVAVVKGSYIFPDGTDGIPVAAPVQEPLEVNDRYFGEPGQSALCRENDFAPGKPACDVILHGNAHAPHGQPTSDLQVGLTIGSWEKTVRVFGDRTWQKHWLRLKPGAPAPFTVMPLTYERAFGGEDPSADATDPRRIFRKNPFGVGFRLLRKAWPGTPLPNFEHPNYPIIAADGDYAPMAFGPIARNWLPRSTFAGTYDQRWQDEISPLLPDDFSPSFHQCAPADQQIPFPVGGEIVRLDNLTQEGTCSFLLPKLDIPALCIDVGRRDHPLTMRLDTIHIDAERRHLSLTWRASLRLQDSIHEIQQVVVGDMPASWHKARRLGKAYHRSIDDLIRSRRHRKDG